MVRLDHAAAHRADPGDILIIAAYSLYSESELDSFHPNLVYVDGDNRIIAQRNQIPVQIS